MTAIPPLIPELDVEDIAVSLCIYTEVFGFTVLFERPEDGFAMIEREGAQLMLEEAEGPGRRFRTAPLERPYGRGVNLQIRTGDVHALHAEVIAAGLEPLIALEERWYRQDEVERGARQFVIADPDGYLLRFFSDLGVRPG
jgi:catechol 2,3-dioxygenase-like lactoylglutathione lyase family enzyme